MLVFLTLSTNHELKILTPCGTLVILTTSKTPFSSRPLSSFCLESVYRGEGVSACRKIDISATFCWNRAGSRRVCSTLRRGCCSCSVEGFAGCSWSVLLSGSDSGPFTVRKYGLTVVDLKDVRPEGN